MKFTIRDLCLVTVCAALAVNSCRLEQRVNDQRAWYGAMDNEFDRREQLQNRRIDALRSWLGYTNNDLDQVIKWAAERDKAELDKGGPETPYWCWRSAVPDRRHPRRYLWP